MLTARAPRRPASHPTRAPLRSCADLMERASSASGALAVVGVVAVLGAGAYLGRDKLRSLVGLGGIPPTGVEK